MGPSELLTRADVLKLLSHGEEVNVGAAEARTQLRKGDQYLDLAHLELGVLRADGVTTGPEHLLPRKAVHEDTWRRILRQLKTYGLSHT